MREVGTEGVRDCAGPGGGVKVWVKIRTVASASATEVEPQRHSVLS